MKRSHLALAGLFFLSGLSHFVFPSAYARAVPAVLPRADRLVAISGGCELLGAAGLLMPRTRRVAGWGLTALLVAVFPANVSMALDPGGWPSIPAWALWARLPLQLPLIAWTWRAARAYGGNRKAPKA